MIVECNLSQDELIKNNIGIQDTSDAKFGEKWALITIYDKIITTDKEFDTKKDDTIYLVKGISYGENAHSEGYLTMALGEYSHAEGYNTNASGTASHAGGYYTIANHKA